MTVTAAAPPTPVVVGARLTPAAAKLTPVVAKPTLARPDAGASNYDHLVGLAVTATAGPQEIQTSIRLLATIAVEGTTAEFTLQPITSPDCDKKTPGTLVGDARTESAEVDAKGAFEVTLTAATLPMGSVGGAGSDLTCAVDIVGDLTITGSLQASGEPCGAITGSITSPLAGTAEGTFGSVAIEPGTIGDDLPAALEDCK